jgi:hypothetical protein
MSLETYLKLKFIGECIGGSFGLIAVVSWVIYTIRENK